MPALEMESADIYQIAKNCRTSVVKVEKSPFTSPQPRNHRYDKGNPHGPR
jgi:hypothetical protein